MLVGGEKLGVPERKNMKVSLRNDETGSTDERSLLTADMKNEFISEGGKVFSSQDSHYDAGLRRKRLAFPVHLKKRLGMEPRFSRVRIIIPCGVHVSLTLT